MVKKFKLDEDKEGKVVDPSHYHDANHAGCQDTHRSTSGSVQFLGEKLISWSSKRQKSAAISSTEAEYIALSGCDHNFRTMALDSTKFQCTAIIKVLLPYVAIMSNTLGLSISTLDTTLLKSGLRMRTMDTIIDQQVARNEALVPHAKRLKIGRSNFRLLSDIKSKESTLQLVYDVMHLSQFFKAFLMDNKKHIVNLESFREMLHIYPRLPHQPIVEPPFEEEILAFLCFLRHSAVIRKLTNVNINKLHQPWRAFAAIINKCLTGKSSGHDSLRLNTKIQRQAMRCIILGSRMLSSTTSCQRILLFQGETRLTTSEKGKQETKESKAKSLSSLSEVAMTEAQKLELVTKRSLQQTHISQASGPDEEGDDDEGKDDDGDDDGEEGDGNDDDEDDDERHDEDEEKEEDELYSDININQGRGIQTTQEVKDSHVTLTTVNPDGQQQSSSMSLEFVTSMLNPTPDAGMESIFGTTSQMDVQTPTSVAPLPMLGLCLISYNQPKTG
nr:retrotransposon protein, putative, unclassified [Tanacetum cinerariifolium]